MSITLKELELYCRSYPNWMPSHIEPSTVEYESFFDFLKVMETGILVVICELIDTDLILTHLDSIASCYLSKVIVHNIANQDAFLIHRYLSRHRKTLIENSKLCR